jgi:hypothetical protein
LGRKRRGSVDEKVMEVEGGGYDWEEERSWGVDSARRLIRWIVGASDILCEDAEDSIGRFNEGVNSLENDVDCVITMPAIPPSFDDPHVVSVDNDVLWCLEDRVDSVNKEFESDCFGPTDVSLCPESFPSRDEAPSSPTFSNNDTDTDF